VIKGFLRSKTPTPLSFFSRAIQIAEHRRDADDVFIGTNQQIKTPDFESRNRKHRIEERNELCVHEHRRDGDDAFMGTNQQIKTPDFESRNRKHRIEKRNELCVHEHRRDGDDAFIGLNQEFYGLWRWRVKTWSQSSAL